MKLSSASGGGGGGGWSFDIPSGVGEIDYRWPPLAAASILVTEKPGGGEPRPERAGGEGAQCPRRGPRSGGRVVAMGAGCGCVSANCWSSRSGAGGALGGGGGAVTQAAARRRLRCGGGAARGSAGAGCAMRASASMAAAGSGASVAAGSGCAFIGTSAIAVVGSGWGDESQALS